MNNGEENNNKNKREKAYKAMKLRLYPTEAQKQYFHKNIGCSRFIYNYYLEKRKTSYEESGKQLTRFDCSKDLTELKKENVFLQEVDSTSLLWSITHLDAAFKNFFRDKSIGYPQFKSKYTANQSFTVTNVKIGKNHIILPKIGKVTARGIREFDQSVKYKAVTISYAPSGKFYASVRVEYENDVNPIEVDTTKVLGLSYSVPHLYADSDGCYPEFKKFYKESSEKLAQEQQKMSRMVKDSNNYMKQKMKIAKIHEHIANQRNDYLHKLTRNLADKYDLIFVEDVSVSQLIQKIRYKNARKSILDNGWSKFTTILEQKMKERGKYLIKVNSDVPVSHICSSCGCIVPLDMKLGARWDCPDCGYVHQKEQNSAINIKNIGLSIHLEESCK